MNYNYQKETSYNSIISQIYYIVALSDLLMDQFHQSTRFYTFLIYSSILSIIRPNY